jgi:mono/diheme cytochrome c family protein
MSGLEGRERRTLETLTDGATWVTDRPEHRALLTALATAVGNQGRPDGKVVLERLTADTRTVPGWQREAVRAGMKAATREVAPAKGTAAPRDAATTALVEQGRTGYAICAACHQQDGRGLPALAPPLAGAASVTGPADALIDIVLQGRDVDPAYPSMPPLGGLSDAQLSAVLTYVRQAWGNAAPAISEDAVRARRSPEPVAAHAQTRPPEGFTHLFNGKDLSGWRGRPGKGGVFSPYVEAAWSDAEHTAKQAEWNADRDTHWRVDAARGELVTDGLGVHLATEKAYGNFDLRLEWKLTERNGITGVYLRSYPQVQLWDPASATAQKTGAFRGSGALWNNNDDNPGKWPLVKADNPIGAWNHLRVKMVGDRVWVWLNGEQTVDGQRLDNYFDRSKPLLPTGAIELQTHGSEVRFRNLFIRELDADGR